MNFKVTFNQTRSMISSVVFLLSAAHAEVLTGPVPLSLSLTAGCHSWWNFISSILSPDLHLDPPPQTTTQWNTESSSWHMGYLWDLELRSVSCTFSYLNTWMTTLLFLQKRAHAEKEMLTFWWYIWHKGCVGGFVWSFLHQSLAVQVLVIFWRGALPWKRAYFVAFADCKSPHQVGQNTYANTGMLNILC